MDNLISWAAAGIIAGGGAAALVDQQRRSSPPVSEPMQLLQQLPPDAGPGNMAAAVPSGQLPLDATPTAAPERGAPSTTSTNRPTIQLKPSWLPSWLAPQQPDPRLGARLLLTRSSKTVASTGDPIWELKLVQGQQTLAVLPALSGRANRQQLNRHTGGNKSPLPPGDYRIVRNQIEHGPFADPELGRGYWIPIQPLFQTGRADLGLHQDPSWGKRNGESGTSGCIGLDSAAATQQLVEWIKHFHINQLTVEA